MSEKINMNDLNGSVIDSIQFAEKSDIDDLSKIISEYILDIGLEKVEITGNNVELLYCYRDDVPFMYMNACVDNYNDQEDYEYFALSSTLLKSGRIETFIEANPEFNEYNERLISFGQKMFSNVIGVSKVNDNECKQQK